MYTRLFKVSGLLVLNAFSVSCIGTLLTIATVYVDDFLPLLCICLCWYIKAFPFVVFLFLVVAGSFPPREVPLASVIKLVWWC